MNPLDFFFQFAAVFVSAIIALTLGRALAARIAGPHAGLVLSGPIIAINIALPHRRETEEDQEVSGETGNTETGETLGNTTGNSLVSPDSDVFEANDMGERKLLPRMTSDERNELLSCRNSALILLSRCIDYYKTKQEQDIGVIPRYDKVGTKAEYRGMIVDTLEYSGFVSKTKNKTFVVPEIGTCTALFELIRSNQRRVYPVGYAERKQATLDAAVNALPEYERE